MGNLIGIIKFFKSCIVYPRKFKICFWPTFYERQIDDTLILINGISRIALIFDQMDGTDYRATQTNVEHVKTFSKNRLE